MSGLVLKRSGHHVRIFERSPSTLLQSQGAGIIFGIEGHEFLSKHVLVDRPFFVNSYLRQTLGRDGIPIDSGLIFSFAGSVLVCGRGQRPL